MILTSLQPKLFHDSMIPPAQKERVASQEEQRSRQVMAAEAT